MNPRSCTACRRRKVRCDKGRPCANCVKYEVECIFPFPGRARPKPRARVLNSEKQTCETLASVPRGVTAPNSSSAMSKANSLQLVHYQKSHTRGVRERMPHEGLWIERCWYLGDRLPKLFYQVDEKLSASPLYGRQNSALMGLNGWSILVCDEFSFYVLVCTGHTDNLITVIRCRNTRDVFQMTIV